MKKLFTILFFLLLAFAAGAQEGSWTGKMEFRGSKLTVVFHLDGDEPGMDCPDQALMGVPVQVERTATGGIKIKIPVLGATYEGMWMLKQIAGTFMQNGVAIPLTLTPEAPLRRPQNPVPPFPYAQEEVTFDNGDAHLAGTLVLPEGCTRATPVLVMVTGSGQENRDEEIYEHRPFAVIADALGRAGIATLRFDDRGVGGSTGDVLNATTIDFKNDALAGMRLLRERFDKVGVLGHSEGGTIALMLAAEGEADFIVSLAGVAVSGIETTVRQGRTAMENAGYAKEDIDTYCKAIGEACEVRVHGGRMPFADELDLPDELKQNYLVFLRQIQSPWMITFLGLDMRPLLGGIACPVLALNGTRDTQVDCESNLGALREGLPASPKNHVEAIEGVNHLFQHCTTGSLSEYRKIEETIAPKVLEMIVAWINGGFSAEALER